ncbi:MAG: MFS transporter [Steroidobacteraceae bacterium]
MNTDATTAYPRPAYAWYVVVVLLLAYILSFIDRDVLSLLVGEIKRELALSEVQIGTLLGVPFALFYATCGIFIAWLADRGRRTLVIFTGVVLWSLATVCCALADSYWGLFTARIGVAVGEAALTPPVLSLLKDYFPPDRVGRAIGLYTAGVSGGGGIANIIGGSLYPALIAGGATTLPLIGTLDPWQLMFVVVGLPGLIVALLILTIREPVRRDRLTGTAGTAAPPSSVWATLRFVGQRWRSHVVLFIGLSSIAIMAYGVNYWVPEFLRRSFSLSDADYGYYIRWRGLLLIVFGLIGVVGGGWLCDVLRKRHADGYLRVVLIGLGFLIVGYTLLPLMPTPTLAVLMVIPATLGGAIPTAAGAAAVMAIAPSTMRAQIIALYYFTLNLIGFAVGPNAVAALTQYVFRDDLKLNYSLAIVAFTAATIGIALCLHCRAHYRRCIAEADGWQSASPAS